MTRVFVSVWLALALLGAEPQAARAQPVGAPPSVAVFPIESGVTALNEAELADLTRRLGERFAERSGARLLPVEEVEALMHQRGLESCFDRNCQTALEQELRVDYGLVASVSAMGKGCLVTGSLYVVGASITMRTAVARGGCAIGDLRESVALLAVDLMAPGYLPAPGRLVQPAPGAPPEPPAPPEPVVAPEPPAPPEPVVAPEPLPEEEPLEDLPIDHRPHRLLAAALLYSPAPLVSHHVGNETFGRKLYDQIGARVSLDFRVARYLTFGPFLQTLGSERASLVDFGGRFGALVPIGEQFDFYGYTCLAVTWWKASDEERLVFYDNEYVGLQFGAGAGLLWMFLGNLGLQIELAGNGTAFPAGDSDAYYDEGQDFVLWRLVLSTGLVWGF